MVRCVSVKRLTISNMRGIKALLAFYDLYGVEQAYIREVVSLNQSCLHARSRWSSGKRALFHCAGLAGFHDEGGRTQLLSWVLTICGLSDKGMR